MRLELRIRAIWLALAALMAVSAIATFSLQPSVNSGPPEFAASCLACHD